MKAKKQTASVGGPCMYGQKAGQCRWVEKTAQKGWVHRKMKSSARPNEESFEWYECPQPANAGNSFCGSHDLKAKAIAKKVTDKMGPVAPEVSEKVQVSVAAIDSDPRRALAILAKEILLED